MVIKPFFIIIFLTYFRFHLNKKFSFDLFSSLTKSNWFINTNVLLSPILVSKTLLFLSNGSIGKTQKEIIDTLGYKSVIEGNKFLNLITKHCNIKSILKFSNAIFSRIPLSNNFKLLAQRFNFDFKNIFEKGELIEWIGNNTNYQFNEIFNNEDPKTFDFILISTLSFIGNFKSSFTFCEDPTNVYFYDESGKRKKIQMLEIKGMFNYYYEEKFQVIEIPFEQKSISSLIFIPSNKYNLQSLIEDLNEEKYNKIIKQMTKSQIELYIPKLKIEYKTPLANSLKNIGIKKAFRIDAEFPSITLNYGLHLTDFFHQASLEINESLIRFPTFIGLINLNNKKIIPYKRINVNKPFFLIIKSNDFPSDFILMAKITNIDKKDIQ